MENPIKMDDLGVPLFLETPLWFGRILPRFQTQEGTMMIPAGWQPEIRRENKLRLRLFIYHDFQGFIYPRWCRISEPSTVVIHKYHQISLSQSSSIFNIDVTERPTGRDFSWKTQSSKVLLLHGNLSLKKYMDQKHGCLKTKVSKNYYNVHGT